VRLTTRLTSPRPGLSLVEMLAIVAGLGMVLVFSASLLAGAYKIEAAAGEAFRRQNSWSALADQFRADVALAQDAPDRWDTESAGQFCLILRKPDGQHVVYAMSDGQLQRSESTKDGNELRRVMPLGWEHGSVQFAHNRSVGTISLRILPPPGLGPPGRSLEIAAALGGDLR
jgi:hypothetical protein